jgi:hypothetical protein
MIRIEFHRRDRSLLEARISRCRRRFKSESSIVKAFRTTTPVSRVRFSNPPRCGNDRGLLLWRLSERKSRQRERLEELIFEDPDAPDRGFPKQRLRYGVHRHLRRFSYRDARRRVARARHHVRSRRVHPRR